MKYRQLLLSLLLLLLLAACRRDAASGAPTAQPTPSPTLRSTPLPAVATAIPAGAQENPLRWVLVPAREAADEDAERALETALVETSGVAVDVVRAERPADALAALCDSSGGTVSAAWLDGLTYAAALAQGCGQPALQWERGTGRSATTGETVQFIANAEAEIESVAGLADRTVCRAGFESRTTWLIPSLLLRANGVDPLEGLDAITDQPDVEALIDAVADGMCDAAGISAAEYAEFASAEARDQLVTLPETVEVPYGILMYPVEASLSVRVALENALLQPGDALADALEPFFDRGAAQRLDEDALAQFAEFIGSTGLDLARLGE